MIKSLTAGSGSLATLFWDGASLYFAGRAVNGIVRKDADQISEGIYGMSAIAVGDVGGQLVGKGIAYVFSRKKKKKTLAPITGFNPHCSFLALNEKFEFIFS